MASQWPAIIGTLSGASVGVASAWLLERSRWKRQRSDRWEDVTRSALAAFLGSIQGMIAAARNVAFDAEQGYVKDDDDGWMKVLRSTSASRAEAASRLAELQLVTSLVVGYQAEGLFAAAQQLQGAANAGIGDTWTVQNSKVEGAVASFRKLARKELGLDPLD